MKGLLWNRIVYLFIVFCSLASILFVRSRFNPTNGGSASWSANSHQGGGMPKREEALLFTQQG